MECRCYPLSRETCYINESITVTIVKAAAISIPRSKGTGKKKMLVLWNTECEDAVMVREKAKRDIGL